MKECDEYSCEAMQNLEELKLLNVKQRVEINKLEKKLKIATDILEFYADEFVAWDGGYILNDDIGITDNNRPSGGERARYALLRLRDTQSEA